MGDDVGDLVITNLAQQGFDPLAGLGSAFAVEFVGDGPEVGVGVKEIQALDGIAETVFDEIPDPDGSVCDDQNTLGLGHAANPGLVVELGRQGLDATAGGDVTAFGDDRAGFVLVPSFLTPVLEAETSGGVDPVPPFQLLLRLAHGLGLAPKVSLPDIPGVDLEDQGKGFWA